MYFGLLNRACLHRAAGLSSVVFWMVLQAPSASALEVSLTGPLDDDLRETLENGSLLFEQAEAASGGDDDTPPVRPQEIVSVAQADYKRLLAILYDQGYFSPVIEIRLDGREATGIQIVNPPPSIGRAVITVQPGSAFRFGRTEIDPLAPETELPEGFRSGEPARLSEISGAAAAGVDGWREAGHAKATLTQQKIIARHSEDRIDVDLNLAPGPKLRFGPLTVRGNEAVRTERILEIAGLPVGEDFSPDELNDAAARLRRSGAFGAVAMIEAEQPGPGDTLPITARVAEAKPRRFGFGGELGTEEGVSLSAYWLHRNYFGGAERLRFDAEVSGIGGDTGGIDYSLGVRYQRPATFNEDTDLYLLAEVEQIDSVNYFSRQATIGAGIERFASDQRKYRFGGAFQRANTRDVFGESSYLIFMVPTGLNFDYRDSELDARRGYYFDLGLTPFLAIDGSDNGLLSEVDLRGYRTFGSTTLALRGQLGSVAGPSLADAPADFLFYSGGGGTVRGHDFESLGVDLGGGQIAGGRSFVGLQAEVRYRTSGALGLVGFFDAGYIGSEAFPDGSGEWQSGAGLGVRYDTPIGPIRFDVATAVSGDQDAASFQVYIGIGQSF